MAAVNQRMQRSQLTFSFKVCYQVCLVVVFLIYCCIWREAPQKSTIVISNKRVRHVSNLKKSRRRFVNYTSSQWELLWLQNIQKWEKEMTICDHVFSSEQAQFLHKFQLSLCTHHIENSDWCAVVDPYAYSSYFYNKKNLTYAQFLPNVSWDSIAKIIPFPVLPDDNGLDTTPLVFSRLDFLDETTGETFSEYIEPLVSHLRHPVAKCENSSKGRLPLEIPRLVFILSRSYIIPVPSGSSFQKAYYFDAGASAWNIGGGGPSLHYFTTVWKRHGID